MKQIWVLAAALALVLGACGGDDGGGDAASEAPTTAAAEEGSGAGEDEDEDEDEVANCPPESHLEIVTGGESEGAIGVVTAWADKGSHPANTVGSDAELELLFTDYEVEPHEQFGYSIPIAGSQVPPGGVEVNISLFNPEGAIEAGQVFVDQTRADEVAGADGEINFISLFEGSERSVLGDATVTITELTDDVVCGEITGVSETELQELTAVEGAWVAERIQAIDDEDDEDDEVNDAG